MCLLSIKRLINASGLSIAWRMEVFEVVYFLMLIALPEISAFEA
jgi:hypothetical protein